MTDDIQVLPSMALWKDPKIVGKVPLVTTVLLVKSNIDQLWQMWHEHTAAGQSLSGWITLGLALWLFCWFYRVCCPKEKFVFWCTVFECVVNLLVISSVVWFRYLTPH